MIIVEKRWFEWDTAEQKEVPKYLARCFYDSDRDGIEMFLNDQPWENAWRNVEHKFIKIYENMNMNVNVYDLA